MKKSVRFLFLLLLISFSLLSFSVMAEGEECVHNNISQIPGSPAGCTADGVRDCYVCNVCGLYFEDPSVQTPIGDMNALDAWKTGGGRIPAAHVMGAWEADSAGLHYRMCQNCTYSESHDAGWDGGVVTLPPACEAAGVRTYSCTLCSLTYNEEIPALVHEYGDWTALDSEQHQRVCIHNSSHIETAEHRWDEGSVTKGATCDEDGEGLYICSVCGETKTAPIPHGHEWGEWQKGITEHSRVCLRDPSHTESGEHEWDQGEIIVSATCTEDGEKKFTCKICGATKREFYPATGHLYSEWKKTDDNVHQRVCAYDRSHIEKEDHHWDSGVVTKEPTIASKGKKVYHCDVCAGTKEETLDRLPLDTKTEATALKEVPAELKANPELDTVEKITAALKAALKKKSNSDKTAVYDVRLMYSTDNGKTWQEGGKEFFPAGGKLLVTIPYPSGTNSVGYDFVAAHMFGSSDFGKTPGNVEYPAVTKGKDGLRMEVTGLSPIAISWKSTGVSTGDDSNMLLWAMLLAISSAALCAAVMCGKKCRKEQTE